jgi:hypothetical protein
MRKLLLFFLATGTIYASAQCRYIPSTNSAGDTVVWTFTGGAFQSYGCAPVDPTRWLSGNGISVLATFVSPQNYPVIRVWGMNDDDFASIEVNGTPYPLSTSTASYAPKVVCGVSPGPDGVLFSGGQLTGANTNNAGNYSYSDVTINASGVNSIRITGTAGNGWGFAGVLLYCQQSTSVGETLSPGISIYPNPSSGIIRFSGSVERPLEVTVYNALGECVYRSPLVTGSIDISALPAGLYDVQACTGTTRTSKKIIKQ